MIIKQDLPALLVGIMCTMVSIGLARFAYTPLLPELISQQWFSEHEAVYLGAANLLGYFIGAITAHQISEKLPLRLLLNVCFVSVTASFIACAIPLNFEWFFVWRLIAGIAGAILMVVGPASIIANIPIERRASIGTLMFTGIGIGALLSATLIPLLVDISLTLTWFVLATFALLAGWVNGSSLSKLQFSNNSSTVERLKTTQVDCVSSNSRELKGRLNKIVRLVLIAYGFDALGFIPHTIFWVDYLAREKELGTSFASVQWGVFGLGAMCGPFIARYGAQKLGWAISLNVAFFAKTIAIILPVLFVSGSIIGSHADFLDIVKYSISSFIVGAMVPGIVSLTSGRIAELVGPIEHKKYWGWATAIFALAQAISGYSMSGLYEIFASYHWLFFIASGLMAMGLALSLLSSSWPERAASLGKR